MTSPLQISLLGNFRIVQDDEPVTGIENVRLQSLLAYLVLHRDAPQPRAQLSYLFWLGSTEVQARANLRKQVYHLRRVLEDADRFLYADHKVLQWQAEGVAGLMAVMESYDSVMAMSETARTFGVELTPLEIVVGRMFGGASS